MNAPLHYTRTPAGVIALRSFVGALLSSGNFSHVPRYDANGNVNTRADAVPSVEGATAFLSRELQYVTAKTYDVLYKPIMARTLVPFTANVPAGAEQYAYDQYEMFGKAVFLNDDSTNWPRADVRKKRFAFPMATIGLSYKYTDQDMQASRFAGGKGLDVTRAQATRMGIEQLIDDLVAFGDSIRGIRGIAGQTDFTSVSPVTGSWSTATTAAQLLGDLNKLALASELATGGLFVADTMVLPLAVKPLLQNPWSTGTSPITIEQAWLATQGQRKDGRGIKEITYWNKLDSANAGGTGGRALCYTKSDQVLEMLLSYDYQEFVEPSSGLVVEVKAKARLGGLSVKYPLACCYSDIQ